jgi:hypothetical protein
MSVIVDERFTRLIGLLELRDIKPMDIHSWRVGSAPAQNGQVQLEWKHAIADGDPVAAGPGVRVFRPRYELAVSYGGAEFFRHTSVFILAFAVKDEASFDQLWSDQSLRKVFTERQIQRTMWPIFRQQVLDGTTRLGIPGVVLPWLM